MKKLLGLQIASQKKKSFLFLIIIFSFLCLTSPILAKEKTNFRSATPVKKIYTFKQIGSKMAFQEGKVKGISTTLVSVRPRLAKITTSLWKKLGIEGLTAISALAIFFWIFLYFRHKHRKNDIISQIDQPPYLNFSQIRFHFWLLKHLPLKLQPNFIREHPYQTFTLKDNFLILIFHPAFKALRYALLLWLIFSFSIGAVGIYSLLKPSASEAATIADDTQAEFDAGTYSDTQWNGTNSWVELNATGLSNGSGSYISSVQNAGGISSWDSIEWTPERPIGKELPDNSASETAYNSGNANMTGNVLLMHMNESSGTIADTSGNGNNGTSYGGVTYGVTGKLNTALSFDGISDYVDAGNDTSLDVGHGTWEAWIYPTSFSDHQYHTVVSKFYNTAYWFGLYADGGRIQLWVAGGAHQSTGAVDLNKWSHIAATWDGSVIKYYINGEFDSQNTGVNGSPVTNSYNAQIGADPQSALYRFTGKIDELAIFNRSLSATEILDHYKRGALKLKYQVRSDSVSPLTTNFIGPNGTTSDYYEWGENRPLTTPSFTLANVANNQYFQYKAFFETSSSTYTPELKSVTTNYTFINSPPNTPVNLSPADGVTNQSLTPTLTASNFSDPDAGDTHSASQWQISTTSADYSSPTYDSGSDAVNLTSTTISPSILSSGTTYYWHVRYKDNYGNWSNYSSENSLTTSAAPDTPTNSSPSNGAMNQKITPTLSGSAFSDSDSAAIHSASQWLIRNLSDASYSSPVYDSGTDITNLTSISIPSGNLSKNTTYFWKVRYQDEIGIWSSYSSETAFSTGLVPITVIAVGATEYTEGETARLNVQVKDASGDVVNNATVTINIYNPSANKLVDSASMTHIANSNGLYYYDYVIPATIGVYTYDVTATYNSQTGYSAHTFHVAQFASDITSIKSTVESEQTAQTAERTAQAASRTKVEDIQTRVTAIQSDVTTIKSDVSSAKSTIDNVWSRLQTLTGTLPSDYTGVYKQLVSIANTLSSLGVLKGSGAESLYSLSEENKNDTKYLKNKILDLQAAIEINRVLLAAGGQDSIFSTWYTFHSVVLNMLIANPTNRKAKIPFKAYLPKEVKQEHIISSDGLKIEYDNAANSYVALGEFELKGGESITRQVEIKDIWLIDEAEIEALKKQVEELSKQAKKTIYSGQMTVLKNDILMRLERILRKQKDATATPQDHILAYRENKEDLGVVKENLKKMTDLISSAGANQGLLASVAGINTFAVWGIIVVIITGLTLLGLMFFSMWKHQMALIAQMTIKNTKGKVKLPDSKEMMPLTSIFLPKIKWKTLLLWTKKVFLLLSGGVIVFGLIKVIIYSRPWGKLKKQQQTAVMAPLELQKEANPSPSPSSISEIKKIIILKTETGWLNMRNGPGISYKKISKVNAGDEFVELERKENGKGKEWVKIKIDGKTSGWVLGKYVEKIPPTE